MPDTNIFLQGFDFTESLRWHLDHLWFCDLGEQKVYCFDIDGKKIKQIIIDDKPAGLGWLSDGALLITSLMKRKLLRYRSNQLSVFKALEASQPGFCHDFAVSRNDYIYLSASGFLPAHDAVAVKSNILLITPENEIKIAATELAYPNGIVITPDEKNLIVSETFASSVSIYEIGNDHTLVNKKTWARFDDLGFEVSFDENGVPKDMNRHYPDGICYDDKLNAVWVASPGKKEVLCVNQSNQILKTIRTISRPFDCALGGKDNRTLYIASSEMVTGGQTGKIECINV